MVTGDVVIAVVQPTIDGNSCRRGRVPLPLPCLANAQLSQFILNLIDIFLVRLLNKCGP
jgi:hypothetical protein